MLLDPENGRFGDPTKGKIAVLLEDHFDPTEFCEFNKVLPKRGYQVEYITHLWGNDKLKFWSNPTGGGVEHEAYVTTEINDVSPEDYVGIILMGAYRASR